MRIALLSACLCMFAAAACTKSSAAERLVGTYELDMAASLPSFVEMAKKKDPKLDDATAKVQAEQMMTMMKMKMSVELKSGDAFTAHFSMMDQPKDENGTWKVDGDKITMTCKVDGKDDVKQGTIVGDTIKVTETKDGQSMTLVLAKKK